MIRRIGAGKWMAKIENTKKVIGRDKRGMFIAEFVTLREARYGHIRIYREGGAETTVVMKTWICILMFYIARLWYGKHIYLKL